MILAGFQAKEEDFIKEKGIFSEQIESLTLSLKEESQLNLKESENATSENATSENATSENATSEPKSPSEPPKMTAAALVNDGDVHLKKDYEAVKDALEAAVRREEELRVRLTQADVEKERLREALSSQQKRILQFKEIIDEKDEALVERLKSDLTKSQLTLTLIGGLSQI